MRLAARLRRDRAQSAGISLDDPIREHDGALLGSMLANGDGYLALMGSATNPIAVLEDRLSLGRAFGSLR